MQDHVMVLSHLFSTIDITIVLQVVRGRKIYAYNICPGNKRNNQHTHIKEFRTFQHALKPIQKSTTDMQKYIQRTPLEASLWDGTIKIEIQK